MMNKKSPQIDTSSEVSDEVADKLTFSIGAN